MIVCVFVGGVFMEGSFIFLLFIVSDTMCAEGVENLTVGLSRIYFKPLDVVPGRFCFI